VITIRAIEASDWDSTWRLLEPVFRAGETYAFPPDISEQEAYRAWVERPRATYVATDDSGAIVGTYYIKPNQSGPGDHVCNCGYIVSDSARGRGVGAEMCRHSLRIAVSLGFSAMQYNLVVATNEDAIRLWEQHGFEVVGRLPKAFRHPSLGLVDALVMYKELDVQ